MAFATDNAGPPMASAAKRKRVPSNTSKAAAARAHGGKRGSRRSAAPGLTAERIRNEALRLIDQDGLDAFSTRRLGAALGCEAMAIYWYYPSKDVLLDAVVDALISKLPFKPDADGDWIDALRRLAHAYRRLAHEHPQSFQLLATRRFATEGTFRFLEMLFELARRGGLDDRTTARFFRLVSSYVGGVALDELAGLRDEERAKGSAEIAAQKAAAAEHFPRLAAVSRYLEPASYDEIFEFGLELLLDAVARAPTEAPPRGGAKGRTSTKRRD